MPRNRRPRRRPPPTLRAVPAPDDVTNAVDAAPPQSQRLARGEVLAVAVLAAALVVLVLVQAWGRIVPETKLALAVDPGRFLGRAVSAWNPFADLGGLQNQAAGYLFPMGPFYWAGRAAGIPAWLVQRLWIGGLFVVALTGAHRLLLRLGFVRPTARVLGALAYALTPGLVGVVAFQSGGQLPTALLPWVMVPLAGPLARRAPRRAAALSGLAVAAMGGINGASTFAVLVVPAVWLLTRPAGRARRRLAAWWCAAVVAAVAWWLVPLAIYSRLGFDFTAYTERAGLTTAPESATQVLRGTGNWVLSLFVAGGPWLPGGWKLVRAPLAVGGSAVALAVGLAGLCRRALPERRWVAITFLLGAVAVGAGYHGTLGGVLWSPVRGLLDGPLVAFRNVAKFAPLVSLPLAIGLAMTVERLAALAATPASPVGSAASAPTWRSRCAPGRRSLAAAVVVALGVVAAVAPALAGRLTAPGSFVSIPGYWRDAGRWLDAHADGTAALLEPGSAFGEYTWGRPLDEPLASVTKVPVAVRDQVPLGSAGATDLLDLIDGLVASGAHPQAVTPLLARAGVGFVVVRNDLDLQRTGAPSPLAVRASLKATPGVVLVASFGPQVPVAADPFTLPAAVGPAAPSHVPAVDIYRTAGGSRAATYEGPAAVLSGDSSGLAALAEAGLLDRRAVVLSGDAAPLAGSDHPWVLTDTNRRRDVFFGQIRDNASYTLAASQPAPDTGSTPVAEEPVPGRAHQTVASLQGAAELSASSYSSEVARRPWTQPFAAFDGDPDSAWVPGGATPAGQWLQVRFEHPVALPSLVIRPSGGAGAGRIDRVQVRTDRQTVDASAGPDGSIRVPLDGAPTGGLRITIEGVGTGSLPAAGPGLASVELPGVAISRPLATPSDRPAAAGDAPPSTILLRRATGDPARLGGGDEDALLDRIVTLPEGATYEARGTVVAVPGAALDALLESQGPGPGPGLLTVSASTAWNHLPRAAADRAVDGDLGTSWVSAPDDQIPSLTLRWQGARTIDDLRLTPAGPAFPLPPQIVIETPGGTRTVDVPPGDGPVVAHFAPLRTSQVTLRFTSPAPAGGTLTQLRSQSVGVSEVAFAGLAGLRPAVPDPAARFDLPCGRGPQVTVDGRAMATAVHGTVGELLALSPLPLQLCGAPVALSAGANRVTAGPAVPLRVTSLVLTTSGSAGASGRPAARATSVRSWGSADRAVQLGPGGAAVLATAENFNAGWTATLDGRHLTAVRLDGWRQAWLVPAGQGGTVHLRFGPERWQYAGLALGALLLALLAAAAALPVRRMREVTTAVEPAIARRRGRRVAAGAGVAVVGLLLGGPLALLLVPLLFVPEPADALPLLAGAAALMAGVVVLSAPAATAGSASGAFSAAAQVFAVLAVLAVGAAALLGGDGSAGAGRAGP